MKLMDIPVKTLNSGFALPAYGLGTWGIGGLMEADGSKDEADVAAIKAALDRGVMHIDTAESYGAGHSEELVGRAIKGFDRSKLIITTKVSAWNQRYVDVRKSAEASLKRLGTEYIDLYLLHRFPEPGIDIKETMRAMDELVADGLIKNIGVCNMTINRFREAQKHTSNPLVCNQVEYSVRVREAQHRGIIRYCQDNDVLVTAWGPLLIGLIENSGVLLELAEKYHKTPRQVALNWLARQQNVVTISKTSSIEHLEENLGGFGWEMTDDDEELLSNDFPDQFTTSRRVPLDYPAAIEA
jgi:diketogulonate reductase-like aldo/keto reductase